MVIIVGKKQASIQNQKQRAMHSEEQMHHSSELVHVITLEITDS